MFKTVWILNFLILELVHFNRFISCSNLNETSLFLIFLMYLQQCKIVRILLMHQVIKILKDQNCSFLIQKPKFFHLFYIQCNTKRVIDHTQKWSLFIVAKQIKQKNNIFTVHSETNLCSHKSKIAKSSKNLYINRFYSKSNRCSTIHFSSSLRVCRWFFYTNLKLFSFSHVQFKKSHKNTNNNKKVN